MTGAVRGVLLDLDDTLIDTRGAFRAALGAVAAQWLPHLPDAEPVLQHWVRDDAGVFAAYTRGEIGFDEQRRRRAEHLHADLGGPTLGEAEYARWNAAYEAALNRSWRAHADGMALVALLARRGLPAGVVTNSGRAYQEAKLAQVGFAGLPVLAAVDDLGRGKPDPAMFRLGCERLGLPPSTVVYVGDELDVDARGARDAGLIGVWLDRHGTGEVPRDVPVIRDLRDLPRVVPLGSHGAG